MSRSRRPRRTGTSGQARARALLAVVVASAALAAAALAVVLAVGGGQRRAPAAKPAPASTSTPTPAPSTRVPTPVARPAQARLVVSARAAMMPVSPSFLGISTEYWAFPDWARHLGLLARALSLVQDSNTLQLRIGGDSADRVFWAPVRELPEWAFELTPGWLREVAQVVRALHARVILDLNLVTATPVIAAQWARVALAQLPRGSIAAFEIGNEPDIYSQASWQGTTFAGLGDRRALPAQITATSYDKAFLAYAHTLARVAPGVPLLGPALAEPGLNAGWISRLLSSPHPGLAAVTVHRYPYSACAHRDMPTYPTIARVLSESATEGIADSLRAAVSVTRRAHLPLRLTELNSVTCGGRRGVSNTFATALWAPDALFEVMRAGAASADIHVRATAINAAFSLTRRGLVAHPLLYGMIMFARTLGSDPRLVSARLQVDRGRRLKAWVVRVRGGQLHVLLIDKGRRSARVAMRLPVIGVAVAQRLQAPSVGAHGSITLGGLWLDGRGNWRGTPVTETVAPGPRGYELNVAAHSAVLVTARLRPRALR